MRAEEGRKRVELVQKSALRRMRWQAILRGWGAWREVCESKRRQEQLLAAAGSRLRRPALVCVWTHWKKEWWEKEAARQQAEALAATVAEATVRQGRLQVELREERERRAAAEARLQESISVAGAERARASEAEALAAQRDRDLAASVEAGEARRIADLERQREEVRASVAAHAREVQLHTMTARAARRLGRAAVLRGWTAWHDAWEAKTYQVRILRASGSRLRRPKLAATFIGWRVSWQAADRERDERWRLAEVEKMLEVNSQLEDQIKSVEAQHEHDLLLISEAVKVPDPDRS